MSAADLISRYDHDSDVRRAVHTVQRTLYQQANRIGEDPLALAATVAEVTGRDARMLADDHRDDEELTDDDTA